MQDAKNGASLSALKTASRGATTVISPTKFKTGFLWRSRSDRRDELLLVYQVRHVRRQPFNSLVGLRHESSLFKARERAPNEGGGGIEIAKQILPPQSSVAALNLNEISS